MAPFIRHASVSISFFAAGALGFVPTVVAGFVLVPGFLERWQLALGFGSGLAILCVGLFQIPAHLAQEEWASPRFRYRYAVVFTCVTALIGALFAASANNGQSTLGGWFVIVWTFVVLLIPIGMLTIGILVMQSSLHRHPLAASAIVLFWVVFVAASLAFTA